MLKIAKRLVKHFEISENICVYLHIYICMCVCVCERKYLRVYVALSEAA